MINTGYHRKNPIFSSSDEILYCHSRSLANVDFIKCKNVLPDVCQDKGERNKSIYTQVQKKWDI